ncbi:aromatic ring-hydroxylating oxygenase subunit alpha [Pseudodonghicola flavimaris]|uniref:Aromatic ring-hydroxylating dioxygenase subunit alpha n=1 Tax=Pseudodonghicola flavimaris TaxID=3050036 RepID=A0ABT7F0C3_9RHOB|nr:aromatic ring-hydroxylating dioxygenase subunit alpha [Pseudodonghicola flavimaris]MDK3018030.1 aromatic ring-hydroxylating dioxygenase subunit alpha [Pseudodonghicola flavimaris]
MEQQEAITVDDIRDLVRPHQVHRRAYADPEVFQLEMERIFGRMWIYLAHESQLRKPGAFFRTRLAGTEVLVTRHTDGEVYVLHNRCPHRGARMCMVDRGNSRLLNCPYHAWSFRPDGTLSTVPHKQSYPESFDMEAPENQMQRVRNVESYRGFIFATLNETPVPLTEQLGEMTDIIDNLLARAPEGEVEISESYFTLEYKGNWKLHLENAADIFHPTFVHSSSVGAAKRAPQNASRLDSDQTRTMLEANGFGIDQWEGIRLNGLPNGHSYMSNFYSKGVLVDQTEDPVMTEYKKRMVAAYGEEKAADILSVDRFNNIIYPNMILNAQHQQMRITIPLAHDRTLIRVQCFRLKGAPDEMFERAIRFLSTLASPASMIFSDDVEMLERCQAGLDRDDTPWLDFSRGLDIDRTDETGSVSGVASEMPMRVQFKAWVEMMTQEVA